jgi:hypothetical protein
MHVQGNASHRSHTSGVVVTIVDDGIEYLNPDLKDNYDPLASYDFNGSLFYCHKYKHVIQSFPCSSMLFDAIHRCVYRTKDIFTPPPRANQRSA